MIEIFIGLLLLISETVGQSTEETKALAKDPKELIVSANNDFSFKIFKILSKDENDVMSSLSILSALSILMNGAKRATFYDLQKFLKFQSPHQILDKQIINQGFKMIFKTYQDSDENDTNSMESHTIEIDGQLYDPKKFIHKLNIANKVIGSQNFKLNKDFKSCVNQYFGADVQIADFEHNSKEETNKVNQWVRNKTNDKIHKIFDHIEKDTVIIILNVIYFKGLWEEAFNEKRTKKLPFYNKGITPIKTNMMTQTDSFRYADSNELGSQVLEMDFIGDKISFVIILPKERNGLKSLKQKINSENFNRVIKSLTGSNIEVFVPKFKVENSYELMKEINPKHIALTKRADLSGLGTGLLKVPKIFHKVFIEVNENGTEAAAVTDIKIIPYSVPSNPKILFRADHPFLYFIRDKTNGMILFSGQLNKL